MGVVIAISLLAILSLSSSEFIVGAQTQANSKLINSTTIESVISPVSNASMPSSTMSSMLSATDDSTSLSTISSVVSSSESTTVPSTSIVSSSTNSSMTSSTSSVTYVTSFQSSSNTLISSSTTSSATTYSSSTDPAYSISFSPPYWLCTPVSVTFTGPLVESGYYGDTLQFQYFQYNPTYPSVLLPIFTDSGLTVTSDTVSYWIGTGEYAQANFSYQPNVAVKVIDLTPKSNGYPPGLIFLGLTNVTPEGLQYCPYPYPSYPYAAPYPAPEFQVQWLVIIASIVLSLGVLRLGKRQRHRAN